MSDTNEAEIEVYVCWEYEKGARGSEVIMDKPILIWMDTDSGMDRELLDFHTHPMHDTVIALANLVDRDSRMYGDPAADGRSRYSANFKLPAEWFEDGEWEKVDDEDW